MVSTTDAATIEPLQTAERREHHSRPQRGRRAPGGAVASRRATAKAVARREGFLPHGRGGAVEVYFAGRVSAKRWKVGLWCSRGIARTRIIMWVDLWAEYQSLHKSLLSNMICRTPHPPPYASGFGWQATKWTDTRRRLGVGVSPEAPLGAKGCGTYIVFNWAMATSTLGPRTTFGGGLSRISEVK